MKTKSKARRRNDSLMFYIPSPYREGFNEGDRVAVVLSSGLVVGKVIRNGGKLYVRVPLAYSSVVKENEEYELKKV